MATPQLNAFGQEIKPLCFTRAEDELLALGYPHLRRLVNGHPDDGKKADAKARTAATNHKQLLTYRVEWPRGVAERFVRLSPNDWFQDWQAREPAPPELGVAAPAGTVSEDEARAILAHAVPFHGCNHGLRVRAVDFLLEQMVGTEVAVDAILSVLEQLPAARFCAEDTPDRQLAGHVLNVGHMLLRLTPSRREHHRARLEALWDTHHQGSKAWEVMMALDRVLHGAKAFVGWTGYDYLEWHLHVLDDAQHLRDVIADKATVYGALDVRFVYLAGPEVLVLTRKHRPAAAEVPMSLTDIGMINHPNAVAFFLEYVGRSSAKDLPVQWLRTHQELARPIVERAAKGSGAASEKAKIVLAAMDG